MTDHLIGYDIQQLNTNSINKFIKLMSTHSQTAARSDKICYQYTELMKQCLEPKLTAHMKKMKMALRKKLEPYKEELMMHTWHPDRMIDWCFDCDERAEINFV